jgi:spermidine synthase
MIKNALFWLNENKTALIVGFGTGFVIAWVFRATIARIFGG